MMDQGIRIVDQSQRAPARMTTKSVVPMLINGAPKARRAAGDGGRAESIFIHHAAKSCYMVLRNAFWYIHPRGI